jgi:5-(aminomethyl)-3-furanmethanol phosphate kinase
MSPIVVKIGGSLAETGRLVDIVELVSRARRPTVIVPGGGSFADAVREAQASLGISDRAAHEMAILAMQQMALAIVALQPKRLVGAESMAAMRRAMDAGNVPVWFPHKLCVNDRAIPADWSITSDGLAARLAERLHALSLILVKSQRVAPHMTAASLAAANIVDAAFPEIVTRGKIDWRIVGPGEEQTLSNALNATAGAVRRAKKAARETSTPRR